MKQFLIIAVICMLACTADSWVNPHPEVAESINKSTQAIIHIDEKHLFYEDVTDENISAAIMDAAILYDLSDDELQAVVDHYAD